MTSQVSAGLPELLDYHEAAAVLHCSTRHLMRLVEAGQLAQIRLGRRVLFAREDLAAAVRRARVEPGSGPGHVP